MATKIQKPRGTMDIFPRDALVWQKIEDKAIEVATRFGFGEIRTPSFHFSSVALVRLLTLFKRRCMYSRIRRSVSLR